MTTPGTDEREHLVYLDDNGEPEECIDECPGCHWEGNADCECGPGNCDICSGECEPYPVQVTA